MDTITLLPHARLPRAHAHRETLTSCVDAHGRAHWLLCDGRPRGPVHDATVVTVDGGRTRITELNAVRACHPKLDALPDGGFVVADARRRGTADHVQVFDASGRAVRSFAVGDAVEHLLADTEGTLWAGYFDEGVFGSDPLSAPGLRRWSAAGEPLWELPLTNPGGVIADCYALNVAGRTAWACYYTDFPLVRVRADGTVRAWSSPVAGAHALAVLGPAVAYAGGYGTHDRLTLCRLDGDAATPYREYVMTLPDGSALGRHRAVGRGSRLFVQPQGSEEWLLWDLGSQA